MSVQAVDTGMIYIWLAALTARVQVGSSGLVSAVLLGSVSLLGIGFSLFAKALSLYTGSLLLWGIFSAGQAGSLCLGIRASLLVSAGRGQTGWVTLVLGELLDNGTLATDLTFSLGQCSLRMA